MIDMLDEIEQIRKKIAVIDDEIDARWTELIEKPTANLSISDMKRALIIQAVAVAKNSAEAARLLGMSRRGVDLSVKKMNLTPAYSRRWKTSRKNRNKDNSTEEASTG